MRIAKIIKNDVVNGEDVCVSLFVQGCDRHCEGCFNPETWDHQGGTTINTIELGNEIIELIHKNGIQRNFSILGGEPLNKYNKFDVAILIQMIKDAYPDIKIWLWTGYTMEELYMEDIDICYILHNINVLIDGPYDAEERDLTLPYRGSRNQRVFKLKE